MMQIVGQAHATQDGDGVNIKRIAAFNGTPLDPFLMIDEIRSDDSSDFIGGFPPHPHRGIETFTYIKKGGFEHRDHMGNVKPIRAGDIQWMSTGRGVIHSEMPLADAVDGLHGFQIWLNMPAKDKMRPPRYYDSASDTLPKIHVGKGSSLVALAGHWRINDLAAEAPLQDLAANSSIADLSLMAGDSIALDCGAGEQLVVFCYEGDLQNLPCGFVAKSFEKVVLTATQNSSVLLFRGTPIKEKIVHMGPFVMNTDAEIRQAIDDYRAGRIGVLAV